MLHSARGDHEAALRLLALEVGDLDAAIQYCKTQHSRAGDHAAHRRTAEGCAAVENVRGQGEPASSSLWIMLLELCLRCVRGDGCCSA